MRSYFGCSVTSVPCEIVLQTNKEISVMIHSIHKTSLTTIVHVTDSKLLQDSVTGIQQRCDITANKLIDMQKNKQTKKNLC